ncbi:uncharacterized protein LOC111007492 isoform X2 [Momordica charantia]|uniref:Uncharacterized protein LOC111007492 isoform X2 n=1 Tax=Momordica charantia TaxID=3673 RepID=A0A6J1C568_MOMCH|nr:uncharacterized protein LOC111007492 isoform X2 [Momordica charantia]
METQCFSTPPSSKGTALKSGSSSTPSSSPLLPSVIRLWRPSAQRNIRNQWSKLSSLKQQWASFSSTGRSHATSIVNAYLSQKYMPSMELGSLTDMLDIRKKACLKLSKQQELYRSKLISLYKDMVDVVVQMVNTSRLMRCYFKGSGSSTLIKFSTSSEDNHDDAGDGGGIAVFTSLTIPCFVLKFHHERAGSGQRSFTWENSMTCVCATCTPRKLANHSVQPWRVTNPILLSLVVTIISQTQKFCRSTLSRGLQK